MDFSFLTGIKKNSAVKLLLHSFNGEAISRLLAEKWAKGKLETRSVHTKKRQLLEPTNRFKEIRHDLFQGSLE